MRPGSDLASPPKRTAFDTGFFEDRENEQQARDSQQQDGPSKRQRKQRATLSCLDCRHRKLKCDRQQPCGRCVKGGIAKSCTYGLSSSTATSSQIPESEQAEYASSSDSTPQNVVQTKPNFVSDKSQLPPRTISFQPSARFHERDYKEQFGERLALENSLRSLICPHDFVPHAESASEPTFTDNEVPPLIGLFKGQGYSTFGYGITCPITIVVHFPQLRPFMKEIYPDSTLGKVQDDIKNLEDRVRTSRKINQVLSVPSLRNLLPDRPTVDLLIKQYLDTFETTYRIVHVPSFLADYEHFWNSEQGTDLDALVLAILACVLCTSTHEASRHNPNGSTFRSKAIIWMKACEAWLKKQSNKHRTLTSLQVRCLRLLALKTTCMKTKEFYQETQAHIAYMRAIGLHRDPALLRGKCSTFQAEMRRRLWATSVELELQASIDRGTASILSSLESDCAPPRNINDSELSLTLQQLPLSKDVSEFTDTTFLHILMLTAPLRIRVCSLSNRLRSTLAFTDVLRYESEILDAVRDLPRWSEPRSLQAWTHLDLHLRQLLIILHTPRTLHTECRTKPAHRYAMLACVEHATISIQKHIDLIDAGNFVLCCIRSDYYRAALILTHIAYHAARDKDTFIAQVAQSVFEDTIEKALRLQEERALRPGRGNKQFWYISAACSIVRIQFDPTRADLHKRQAGDRVSRLLYKILSLQDDSNEDYLVTEVILTQDNVSTGPQAASINNVAPAIPQDNFSNSLLGLDEFNFGASDDWMLDDFGFFSDFPPFDIGN
ncbi:hypothetical protein K491DRAFT_51549 [Lophiostoma macrostomum CBS 122681]|uniref:Zn(2)-C6 fungal-type domain-containing protein n=1 Tax=Lophiostoma macrostomum CBS 122681 TaxID=1314788 RepID=A0A6A6T0N6_9PLEO|nr:hypothetical protein K491DRAFT_51549 [Lophiostoma macrostomum CBS 122681]